MPAETALLAPVDSNDAVELSKTLWRKQILPRGTIDYKGRRINFDKQYLTDLAAAFKANAFDQVAFLLAKDDNAHTMDPERFRGEVKGVEVTSQGLDVLLDLTPDAAELVRQNPRLGVSARIIEGLERADGQKFSRAIQHVLGTLDPRVTGMASWQEVSLSEEVVDTVDMTTEEVQMSETTPPEVPPQADPPATEPTPGPEATNTPEEDAAADAELARVAALSNGNRNGNGNTVDMIENQNQTRIAQLELELSRQKFITEMREWIDKGVPPAIVQLARPVLELPQAPVIDLSNQGGSPIDVAGVIRSMLNETCGFVQLAREVGSTWGKNDSEDDRADAILNAWK
jgi:hypothetical protein